MTMPSNSFMVFSSAVTSDTRQVHGQADVFRVVSGYGMTLCQRQNHLAIFRA
ncbi:uncharacterized protein METZ01_LOCUS180535 [marine metagenome]|uniref:Uncharacterized protein n=1 Tax=marine metagenome TaxID=408172 RepID=A0A382CPX8_9ZZZZ